ncbi:uncharacterized protein LOC135826709 [Sycon ciliatum]|uniref:uncharacterized protein LOC135826709 n=1 Tax=Sycon ciliatum TaxID=27933 RepID=UPI0031F66058
MDPDAGTPTLPSGYNSSTAVIDPTTSTFRCAEGYYEQCTGNTICAGGPLNHTAVARQQDGELVWANLPTCHPIYRNDCKDSATTCQPGSYCRNVKGGHGCLPSPSEQGSHLCLTTRAHVSVFAHLATLTEAEEQCRRLGGRLPAGSVEAKCLKQALGTVGAHANETRPWLLTHQDDLLSEGDRYTLHRAGVPPNAEASDARHTVACAFNLREHFCTNETHLVHYPPSKMNNAEMMTPFCQDQKARVPTEGDMKCVEDFRSLIHKETGHVEQNFANQLCVVRPDHSKFTPSTLSSLSTGISSIS